MTVTASARSAGTLLREWRRYRRLSQLDLALDAGVSSRHLSFVETGRAHPSPQLLLALAECLQMPLSECNGLLLAAGYAPRFRNSGLEDPAMTPVISALTRLLALHEPYPGVVIDQRWNVVMANDAAAALTAMLPAQLACAPINVFRACLHPDGLAQVTTNFPEWATYLLGQLRRLAQVSTDTAVSHLLEEVSGYPTVTALGDWRSLSSRPVETSLLVPWQLVLGDDRLSLFTTLTTFAAPLDVTLAELAVELFYPSDERSEHALQRGNSQPGNPLPDLHTRVDERSRPAGARDE